MLVPKKERKKKKKRKPTHVNNRKKKKSKDKKNNSNNKKEEKKKSQHVVNLEVNSKGIFGSSFHELFSLSFLSILEIKLFGGPEEKTPRPHNLFSFLPTQPNTLQKVFIPIFSPKFSNHPISLLNKHTLQVQLGIVVRIQL